MMADLEELCTREGELSELTLFRYLNDELGVGERQLVDGRLVESEQDRARLDELRSFSAGVNLAPPAGLGADAAAGVDNVVDGPWSRTTKIVAAAVVLAAVLALAIMGTRALNRRGSEGAGGAGGPIAVAETEGTRTKGSSFDLRVQVERESTQWLNDDDTIKPGETVQFVAYPRVDGYLLVVGVDAAMSIYPCHPNEGGAALEVQPVAGELVLEGALTFDSVLGNEHIIGLFCPEPFSFDDVSSLDSTELLDGWIPSDDCTRTELRLVKESP